MYPGHYQPPQPYGAPPVAYPPAPHGYPGQHPPAQYPPAAYPGYPSPAPAPAPHYPPPISSPYGAPAAPPSPYGAPAAPPPYGAPAAPPSPYGAPPAPPSPYGAPPAPPSPYGAPPAHPAPYGAPPAPYGAPPMHAPYGAPAPAPVAPYGAPAPYPAPVAGAPPPPQPMYPMVAPMSVPPPPQGWSMMQSPMIPQPVNFQLSNCQGRKRALFVGINYFRQRNELRGCINDVKNIKAFIQRQFFFHFSGHGGQTADKDGDEDDGYDETIYPVDHQTAGTIVDDTLHALLVRPLPAGCRLTAIMDCCHSGSALDLPYIYSTSGQLKENTVLQGVGSGMMSAGMSYLKGDLSGAMNSINGVGKRLTNPNSRQKAIQKKASPADCIMLSGCKDTQTSMDTHEQGFGMTGAMTFSFISALSANPRQSYIQLLNSIREILRTKYAQKPQLSSSHPVDLNLLFT
ncbi:Ca(2+)-dependent cysteine protease, partial [Lunasporangiospora selenospora]